MKTETKTTIQVRQGDVLVESVAAIPPDAELVAPENGRIILAAGEVTGHHHAVPAGDVVMLAKGAERFLRTLRDTTIRHEEHGPISLPGGTTMEVTIQREYTPEAIRNVLD